MKSANEIKFSCFPIAEEYFNDMLPFSFFLGVGGWGGEGNEFGLVTFSGFVHRLPENVRFVTDSSTALCYIRLALWNTDTGKDISSYDGLDYELQYLQRCDTAQYGTN